MTRKRTFEVRSESAVAHSSQARESRKGRAGGLAMLCTVIWLGIATQAQAQGAQLESLKFQSSREAIQDRICGELLTGMTVAGTRSSFRLGPIAAQERMPALQTMGTQAAIFLKVTSDMGDADKLAARASSRSIESEPVQEHLGVLASCERKFNRMVDAGFVSQQHYKEAMAQSLALIQSIVSTDATTPARL